LGYDEDARILVQNIKEFSETDGEKSKKKTSLNIDITELSDEQKNMLKGAIKFFSGDRVNMRLNIVDKAEIKPCGAIFLTEEILEQFKEDNLIQRFFDFFTNKDFFHNELILKG